jgi:hypothetical protein
LNLSGGRRNPFLEDGLAHQCVDEGALAGVELADDDHEEELVELADRCGERGLIIRGGAKLGERVAQRREQVARLSQLSFGVIVEHTEHAVAHAKPAPPTRRL